MDWEDIDGLRVRLHRDFDTAFTATRLPERPDFDRGNALLIEPVAEVYREALP